MYDSVENVNNCPKILKVVITGGPCSGKSSFLPRLQLDLLKYAWKPIIIYETASELITGGIAPWTCRSNLEYHFIQMKLQQVKESLARLAAEGMNCKNIVILCDRGLMDAKAYMTDSEFCQVLNQLDTDYESIMKDYYAVFHLNTVANGFSEFYTTANNEARHESVQEAVEQDLLTQSVWKDHDRWTLISSMYDKEQKYQKLLTCILECIHNYSTSMKG